MADTRYWNKDFMIEFIEIYKSYPCLWKIKCREYTNKNLKNEAYKKLILLCKRVFPDANRDFVVKKIQSIRGSFRKEFKKVEESKRSGTSPGDLYVPSLWYYDLLLFTKDQELPTNTISYTSEEMSEIDPDAEEDIPLGFPPSTSENNKQSNENIEDVSTASRRKNNHLKSKRKLSKSSETSEFMDVCRMALASQSSHDITEFDAVGVSIAKKLQRMESRQAILAESIISTVLTKGLLNRLSDQTNLCDGQCKMFITSQSCTTSVSSRSSVNDDNSHMSRSPLDLSNLDPIHELVEGRTNLDHSSNL